MSNNVYFGTDILLSQSEGCCDRLYVYEEELDGDFVPGAETGGYDNPGFEGTLTSTGPTMYLRWHSDSSGFYPGWKVGVRGIMQSLIYGEKKKEEGNEDT